MSTDQTTAAAVTPAPAAVLTPDAEIFPLSTVQRAMWTAYRIAPDSDAYNIVMPLRLTGRVDPAAMAAATSAVGARQELLRSVFAEDASGTVGRRLSPIPLVALETEDLTGRPEAELFAAAERAGARPFRLESAPFRVVLLRRAEDDWTLVTSAHHIVSDFTSRWLLVRDLLDAYAETVAGNPPASAPLTGWREHVAEELRYTASPSGEAAAAEWRRSVAGSAAGELPLDRPRPQVRSLRGATVVRRLADEAALGVEAAAQATGVSPFAFLTGVFQGLVHRWSGQDDFVLGIPASGRLGRAQRGVVGCYLNTFPLRARVGPGARFTELAARAGEGIMRGMVGVRYPCALALPRPDVFRAALFLVRMDRMEPPVPNVAPGRAQGPAIRYAGLDVALVDVPQQEGQLDLLLRLEQTPDGITAVFSYDTDILDAATVERFADGFDRMLAAAVAEPATPVRAPELAAVGQDAPGAPADEDELFATFENAWDLT